MFDVIQSIKPEASERSPRRKSDKRMQIPRNLKLIDINYSCCWLAIEIKFPIKIYMAELKIKVMENSRNVLHPSCMSNVSKRTNERRMNN